MSQTLGEFDNHPIDLIDPAKAQEAFEYADRLATKDFPAEAYKAKILAARASYLNKDIPKARQLTADNRWSNSSEEVNHKFLKAKYEIAALNAGLSGANEDVELRNLEHCVKSSYKFALIAATDNDFMQRKDIVHRAINDSTQKLNQELMLKCNMLAEKYSNLSLAMDENMNIVPGSSDTAGISDRIRPKLNFLQAARPSKTILAAHKLKDTVVGMAEAYARIEKSVTEFGIKQKKLKREQR